MDEMMQESVRNDCTYSDKCTHSDRELIRNLIEKQGFKKLVRFLWNYGQKDFQTLIHGQPFVLLSKLCNFTLNF